MARDWEKHGSPSKVDLPLITPNLASRVRHNGSQLRRTLRAPAPAIKNIVLLGEIGPVTTLERFLRAEKTGQNVICVESLKELGAIRSRHLNAARLVAFATPVIVPPDILEELRFGAYNFHPGPPSYPGVAPQVFAVYEQAAVFGSTVHLMAEKVDAGPIVEVELFPVRAGITGKELAFQNAAVMFRLFFRLACWLTSHPDPLPTRPIQWTGRKRTRADLALLCNISDDLDPDDLARRKAALGFEG